jgi:hypothetical protein
MSDIINDHVRWITHKGQRIVFSNYRNLEGDAFINQIKQNQMDTKAAWYREGSEKLLILMDITDCTISKEVLQEFKERAREGQSYTKAMAVLGITGVRKFLFGVMQSLTSAKLQAFSTLEEAKDWLVEQADK